MQDLFRKNWPKRDTAFRDMMGLPAHRYDAERKGEQRTQDVVL